MKKELVSFAEVKRAVSLEAILERYGLLGALVRSGANLTGACPFCSAKSQRVFRVSSPKNAWYCFACKEGGNALDFVAKRENVSLPEAARTIDRWFGLGLAKAEEPRQKVQAESKLAEQTADPLAPNEPLTFELKTLDLEHPSLASLGLSEATIERFGLGFCSRGLLKGRIAIPIHSRAGELLAYAGLAPGAALADRYRLPPKFHAALEVFNVHRLPAEPADDGWIYLSADLLGGLRLADAGFARVLALFDGTLSEAQLEILAALLPEGAGINLYGDSFDPATLARLGARYAMRFTKLDSRSQDNELSDESETHLAS